MIEQRKKQANHDELIKMYGTEDVVRVPQHFLEKQPLLKSVTSFHISWFFNDIFSNVADYKEFTFHEILEFLNKDSNKKISSFTLRRCLKELHNLKMFIIFKFQNRWFCFHF